MKINLIMNNKLKTCAVFILIFFLHFVIHAQIININNDANPESDLDLQQLVEQVLISGNCARVGEFEVQTYGTTRETKSFGYFQRPAGSDFPFENGIVLSTGSAFLAGNTTDGELVTTDHNGVSDTDIEIALGITNTFDATFVKFEFTPTSTDFNFDFLMASEEYDGTTECSFADGFAFLIREKGTTNYTNLAVLPDDNGDPTNNTPVSVTNINNSPNCQANEDFFEGYNIPDTNYGGRTILLTASYNVIPETTYEIKLVVADQGDGIYDSAIFLKAGDFNFGLDLGDDLVSANNTAVCEDSIELSTNIEDYQYQWSKDDNEIIGAIGQTYTASSVASGGLGSGIYKCVVSSADGSCSGEDEIEIEFVTGASVNPNITPYLLCDFDNDQIETFNLTTKDTEILDGQDPTSFEVQYYTDSEYNNLILDPINFNNTSPIQTIYVRVISLVSSNCIADDSFEIIVSELPNITQPTDYELCDDDSDGDDTNGITQNFILSTKDSEILGPAQDPADFTVTYYESQDDANNDLNPIDQINPYTNTTANSQPIFVRVTDNTSLCFTVSQGSLFNLVVHPLPVIVANPVLLQVCDTDLDGIASFDLTAANPKISADFINETFKYYLSEADAENEINAITNAANYTNAIANNDTVWARTTTTYGCFKVSQVNLEVSCVTVPVSFQRTYSECDDFLDINGDDNANNDDTDGITTFDFSDVTADIIALFPAVQQANLNISYYESLADADNATNPIADISNHRNSNSPNSQQIFIRIENTANTTCGSYTGTHVTLTVNSTPQANVVQDLNICDHNDDGDDTNGFVQSIDLESQTAEILGTQDPADVTVTYHESAADATAASNPLASPFTNTEVNTQTIYIRVTNNTTGCYTDRSSFNVNVQPLPTIVPAVELKQCDDNTDGFANFNLFQANELISSNFENETFIFFETLVDAQAGFNQIANPVSYTNQVITTDTVWARAVSTFGCYRISEVTLIVATNSTQVTSFPPKTYSNCDDFLDINGEDNDNNDDTDGVTAFNFSDFTNDMIAVFPVSEQPFITVSYYRNATDAEEELNEITNPSDYRNIGYPNTQQIYVRVENSQNNGCIGYAPLITLVVDPTPVINPVDDLQDCDDTDDGNNANGFIQSFNLESQTPAILGSQDPTTYTVTYHTSADDANQGINAITNTTAYPNTEAYVQTIYIRLTHNISGCFADRQDFDIVVNPLPEANFAGDLEVCDDGAGGSAQNGISSNIDLEQKTAVILGTQDPDQFTVTYHTSLADAQNGLFPITGLFTNTEPFIQKIHIRVTNNTTGCAYDISDFNVIINPKPTAQVIVPPLLCDDDSDGDDTNGFIQNIDLDGLIPDILGPDQDEDDFSVTFHETLEDAELGTNPIITPYTNINQGLQTIYVRTLNTDTGCFNHDVSFELVINTLPDFTVTTPQIFCINEGSLTLAVEDPQGIYFYEWFDAAGSSIDIGSETTINAAGTYEVTATTTDGTQCSRTLEIQVNESNIAEINENHVTVVDDLNNGNGAFSVTIDTTDLGIGDYQYALVGENDFPPYSYQDDSVFENLAAGFYTILVRDKNDCGISELDISLVEFPKFFTPNNDGENDRWMIKGVNSTFFPSSEVYIFNRFGKAIAQINIDNQGWDGTFNGKILPSDDYWFSAKLTDRTGKFKEIQGHFSLLRR